MKDQAVSIAACLLLACSTGIAADLATYRLTSQGLGPLKVGMTSLQIEKAGLRLGAPKYGFNSRECEEYPLIGYKGVTLLFQGDRLTSVTVTAPGIQTLSGAHVGMTQAQVKRIYGKKLEILRIADVGEEGGGGTMRVHSSDGKIAVAFQTDEDSSDARKQPIVVTGISGGPAAGIYESCL